MNSAIPLIIMFFRHWVQVAFYGFSSVKLSEQDAAFDRTADQSGGKRPYGTARPAARMNAIAAASGRQLLAALGHMPRPGYGWYPYYIQHHAALFPASHYQCHTGYSFGDYLSGVARATEAFLVAIAIAAAVWCLLSMSHRTERSMWHVSDQYDDCLFLPHWDLA